MEQDEAETIATLRAERDAARAASARDEAVLQQLAETLRWDGAPRALRAVLPLARVLRRARGADAAPAPTLGRHVSRRSLALRIALRLSALTRPVSLPLARHAYRLLGHLEREDALATPAAIGTAGYGDRGSCCAASRPRC